MNSLLKSIIRNAWKSKFISFINLFGLSIGFICSIYLVSWVIHESSYDAFVAEKTSIYRVILEGELQGEYVKSFTTLPGLGPEAMELLPEVTSFTRLVEGYENALIRTSTNYWQRARGLAADSNFFNFFQYEILSGDLSNALKQKDQVVLDRKLSLACFGEEYPVGQTIKINNKEFTVAAVIENVPANSHLQFDFLVPLFNVDWWMQAGPWDGDNTINYLKLNQPHRPEIDRKITDLCHQHTLLYKELGARFTLQPLSDIPYDRAFKFDSAKKTNRTNLVILSAIAFFILLIACINFTNLFISTALKRKKAIGVKIATGATKRLIIKEYFIEVVLFVLAGLAVAVLMLPILEPYLNTLTGTPVRTDFFAIQFLVIFLPLVLITILLAGTFPGLYLNRFNPAEILKGGNFIRGKFEVVQRVLVTTQFVLAIILISSLLLINKQIRFMQDMDLGFNKENVLYLFTEGALKSVDLQQQIKQELSRDQDIIGVSYRGALPTTWQNGLPVSATLEKDQVMAAEHVFVDQFYFDLMEIDLLEGENVFATSHDSMNYCIINQKCAEMLRLEPPFVNQEIYLNSDQPKPLVVKGVVENVNDKILLQQVDACIYQKPLWVTDKGILLIRISGNPQDVLPKLETYFNQKLPEQPFEYHFLDTTYDNLYKSEVNTRSVIITFTVMAILLTSLGLLAMAYFTTEKRTKEIGIRRVNGARVFEIIRLLNLGMAKWVGIAFLLANPVAWYVMLKWQESYAYKTSLSWWVFLLSGVLALTIAMVTVSWHTWIAASRNPVEALRNE